MKYFTYFLKAEPKNFFIDLIRFYQYGNIYTHAGIVLNYEDTNFNKENPYVFAAWSNGILKGYESGILRYFQVPITPVQSTLFDNAIVKYQGDPYGYKSLLDFILRRKIKDKNKFFCSELVYQIAQDIGIDLFTKEMQSYMVYPSLLACTTVSKEV